MSQVFRTVLIANRGEIAMRVLRTARKMGYRIATVYSDADVDAPHVRAADCAYRIGPPQAAESYLNQAAILQAAQILQADAIHPGYGFLAENAEFAQAVIDAGLIWIGPPPSAMRAMGNKGAAKRLLAERDVPMLPGYQGQDQTDVTLIMESARIGFPLMIKAAAGGGGRGMRLVNHADEMIHHLAQARSESQQAFGSGELILERALINPRHIEVQVFGDTHGNIVHLGERDCSVQRRHQKIIEEAPSPAVDMALRARLGEAAIAAARSCAYVGAGTIEFLLDADGNFWFMEMNTRLQVEHPVTEAITGLDLVEWQLRVAAGQHLPLDQQEIDARLEKGGHAIEVRLCAEDPTRQFLPQTGRVALWDAPLGLRVEHALSNDTWISPYYDSMVAKLIAHGANRDEALRNLTQQLDACLLLGVATNQDFLLEALHHPEFDSGRANTGFIARHLSDFSAQQHQMREQVVALATLLHVEQLKWQATMPDELRGWNSGVAFEREIRCELDGQPINLAIRANGAHRWNVRIGDTSFQMHLRPLAADVLRIDVDGLDIQTRFAQTGDTIFFRAQGRNHRVRDLSTLPHKSKTLTNGDGVLRAPMNGRVASVAVQAGQKVEAGQVIVVLEAMKMEHTLFAPFVGTVQALHVSTGEQVEPGRILAEMVSA
jgi:geranyl-CoA carboxylase alpha subunit